MTDWAKFYGVDFHVWNRVVGVQRHTLDRVLLAAALCPETVDSRRVWRRPKSVSDAVSMASECWGEDAERRIKGAMLSFFSLYRERASHHLLLAARFDIRLAAWLAACYSKVAVDTAKESPEAVAGSYRFALEEAEGRINEADLIRASDKATLEIMRWIKDGEVDADYYRRIKPFSGGVDPRYVYVFRSTSEAASFVRSCVEIMRRKSLMNVFYDEIKTRGVFFEPSTSPADEVLVDPESAGRELEDELRGRQRYLANAELDVLRMRAVELAARTFPIEEARSSGATRIASPRIAMGVGAIAGAVIAGYATDRSASRQR